ncbi:MAG: DUF1707 domain-containing protein [Streptosporangiaceae bacterium]
MTGEVSPADRPPATRAQAELRASHEDRDRVVELLRVAAGDGRLTAEELDERLEAALTARTYSELAALTTDLPAAADFRASVVPAEAKDLVRIDCGAGSAHRDGAWVVPQRMEIRVTSGSVRLDLTKAVITGSTLKIQADVKAGSLTFITRPGIVVDTDDVAVRSGSVQVKTRAGADAPVILRIEIAGKVSSGSITARPPRRTFLQWLLRRPYDFG